MDVTRRDFLKLTGMTAAGLFFGGALFPAGCKGKPPRLGGAKEVPAICPLCSMGCGTIVSVKDGAIISIQGDPEHPVNGGHLCAMGSSLLQISGPDFKSRLDRVLYRKPGGSAWEEITWEAAVKMIAGRMVEARKRTHENNDREIPANRTKGVGLLTGGGLNNEESYLVSKFSALMGIYLRDHEGRLGDSPAGRALAGSLGYGAMTNGWNDLKNSDVILVMGSNPVCNYPMSVRHMMAAKERGGKIICVDPRFTNTSTLADIHVAIRPGTDIAFIMGIINYAINGGNIHREYLASYTNAALLVAADYDFRNGFFSGYNKGEGEYDSTSWSYVIDAKGIPKRDKTLKNPASVFQILQKQASRYTPDRVAEITGCGREQFLKAAQLFTSTFSGSKAGSVICSSGLYQHTTGAQNVRALTILQLLLGNIGITGGGVNALYTSGGNRGCIDQGLMNGSLPGNLHAPDYYMDNNFQSYLKNRIPMTNDPMSINWTGTDGTGKGVPNTKKYLVSLLKAWYGENARAENNFCFDWLPKADSSLHYSRIMSEAGKGGISGLMLFQTDPVACLPAGSGTAEALEKLDWLVCADIFESGSSAFWKREGANPGKIRTEVFLLPMALHLEKEGSITNTSRWVQWSSRAHPPRGKAVSCLDFVNNLFLEIKGILKKEPAAFPEPVIRAEWNYSGRSTDLGPDPRMVSAEINGFHVKNRRNVDNFYLLEADGSTACGNWLYSGCWTSRENMMSRRDPGDENGAGLFPGWAWSWPDNRRVLYNRAGVDTKGDPWDSKRFALKWDGRKWTGDVPDGPGDPGSKNPFIMLDEGVARIFLSTLPDGPLPEYYEPLESPVENFMSPVRFNPAVSDLKELKNRTGDPSKFPCIAVTFNPGGGWRTGMDLKNIPWLQELAPCLYCEISPGLAAKKGIANGDLVRLVTRRGEIRANAMVTPRVSPWNYRDKKIEVIGIADYSRSAEGINTLYHSYADPASGAPEYKTFLVNIEKIIAKKS